MGNSSANDGLRASTYRGIAAVLAKEIESGLIAAGAFLPTERALQTRFGASRTTVRRALAKLIEDHWASSVPNRGVVVNRPGRSAQCIAFIDGDTVVLRRMYARLSSSLIKRGYHLVHIDSESIGLENSLQYAMGQGFSGAMVWSFQGFSDADVLREASQRLPLVVLDHVVPGLQADIVTLDYLQMAREVVEELIREGRRRIAVTGMMDMLDTTHQRFSGYMQAHFENNMNPMVRNYVFCRTSGPDFTDLHLLEMRLREPDRPDALFVMQDQWVPHVVDAIHRCGLKTPEDIAIGTIGDDIQVSVDGVGFAAAHCNWDEFADLALETLLERMSGSTEPPRRLLAGYRIVANRPDHIGGCAEQSDALPLVTIRRR